MKSKEIPSSEDMAPLAVLCDISDKAQICTSPSPYPNLNLSFPIQFPLSSFQCTILSSTTRIHLSRPYPVPYYPYPYPVPYPVPSSSPCL